MATVGGSVESVEIRGRTFAVAADADATRDLGGFTKEMQPNGDGFTGRMIMTRKGWKFDGLSLSIDDARADLEFLQEVADSTETVEMSVTLVSGLTYQGDGTITGDLGSSTQNATSPVALGGFGKLTQQ